MDLNLISQEYKEHFNANKALWESRVDAHQETDLYNLDDFKKGTCSLNNIELELLGDINNKSILHIQCHFGQDSLSLARRGANVTGSDISEKAIATARKLNEELDTNAKFVLSNTYDLPNHLEGKFDIVFCSYGVIGWLPDMEAYAKVVAHFLKPGGKFLLVEFHPFVWMFDDDFTALTYPYQNSGVLAFETNSTYADPDLTLAKNNEYNWNHSLGEIINAMVKSGLKVNYLNEYDYSPYNVFPGMIEVENGYQIEGYDGIIPMVFALEVEKSTN